eukprot:TRINITY_DN21018_c0_g1_i1.p1 TRINITY_DN21018_c0_g1~~TRINITY_DN21018_c0_g1_i1.p1  ORF type:complete len:399 (-),score=60.59 TRINITY_DN21018_c0_g1_i1:10-1155(-)
MAVVAGMSSSSCSSASAFGKPVVRQVPTPMRSRRLSGFLGDQACCDMIDYEIKELCRRWPAILEDNTIIRKAQGRYRINGREVRVKLVTRESTKEDDDNESEAPEHADVVGGPGDALAVDSDDLMVRDGPLTQPFLDYVFDTGRGECYAAPDLEAESISSARPLSKADSKRLEPGIKGGLAATDHTDRIGAMMLAAQIHTARPPRAPAMADLDWVCFDDFKEVPVMPPPPSLPWNSIPRGTQTDATAHALDAAMLSTAQRHLGDPSTISPSYQAAKDLQVAADAPQAGSVASMPTAVTKTAASNSQRCEGKRRHLYGEVILPGELKPPLFVPDEPIEPEAFSPQTTPQPPRLLSLSKRAPAPLPLLVENWTAQEELKSSTV